MPHRRLPPLNALRAFEAAARHQSFSRAGRELFVTHGAISRHVAKLETFLGRQLFDRTNQHLALTAKAAVYAAKLQILFDQIEDATTACCASGVTRNSLRISVGPTFALRHLVPRLVKFKRLYPDISLEVETTYPSPDPAFSLVDVAVRWGYGDWDDVVVRRLFTDKLLPVCSPELLPDGPLHHPDELANFLLLHSVHRQDDWDCWLKSTGKAHIDSHAGLRLEYSSLVYQGAIDGLGAAIAQSAFIRDDLSTGRLLPIFDQPPFPTGRAYFIVSPPEKAREPLVSAFIDWLEAESAPIELA